MFQLIPTKITKLFLFGMLLKVSIVSASNQKDTADNLRIFSHFSKETKPNLVRA